jgi:SAM-dependent methyltransferase
MRSAVTEKFSEFLNSENMEIKNVAVVGGSSKDPEIIYLSELTPDLNVHFFGIENQHNDSNFHFLDLNASDKAREFENFFDLVISSQVIEHIWNHSNYFNLLTSILKRGGYLWVNCPASNLVHGSPDYYSSGMTARYLEKNLETRNIQTVVSGQLGNKRYYMATHFARYWQTTKENHHPVLGYNFQNGTYLGVVKKFIFDLPSRILLAFINSKHDSTYEYSTESFFGGRSRVTNS